MTSVGGGSPPRPPPNVALPFDPLARSRAVERACMRGLARRYSRFRAARYYGGIVTADAVGCSFLCAFCWNWARNLRPADAGVFFEPEEASRRMMGLARRSGYHLFRVSGSEPILGEASFAHLLGVIACVRAGSPGARFVVETNGLVLGYRVDLVRQIPREGVEVRVALKGTDEESFERIAGAHARFFEYPLIALRALQARGVEAWPALMGELHTPVQIGALRRRLEAMGVRARLELETLERYPSVMERLRRRGIVTQPRPARANGDIRCDERPR